ncbi:MAG: cohesin domain-containing protein [Patescibacteria group bacterium]
MILRRLILASSIAAACFLAVPAARAAIIYTLPETQQVDPADTFTVDVRLNSENDIINAAQVRVLYDPTALEVITVSKADSFLVLWTEQPKVDATAGVITFSGGTPNGSYVVNGRLVTITFRSKHLGSTNVLFDTGTAGVYRNDGFGTKVTLTAKPATINVALTGRAISIHSTTHPDPDTWYANSFFQVFWDVAADAVYAYRFSDDPTAVPDTRFGAAVREAMYSNVKDGAYTFTLQEKLINDTWGKPVHRRVLVDTKPPEAFTLQLTRDVVPGKLVLVFDTTDATSSVTRYAVREGNEVTENALSPYMLQDQTQHQLITVTAYDAAGNSTDAVVPASTAPVAAQSFPTLPVALGTLLLIALGATVVIVRKRR